MSSPGLPTLTIDVSARRGERRIVVATLLIVPFALWQWSLPDAAVAIAGALFVVAIACGFVAAGWVVGRRRLARIVCQADGRWALYEASGRVIDAELTAATRTSSHAVWLCWTERRFAPLLLLRGDIPNDEFRRLLVRLRVAPSRTRDEHEIAV